MFNLKNISVRTIVSSTLFFVFLYSLIPFFMPPDLSISLIKTIPVILFIQFIILHLYITKYLVNPIGKVQNTLKKITTGDINTPVEYFGMNCAGKLIPDIKNMQKNIVDIVCTISATAQIITKDTTLLKKENLELLKRTQEQTNSITETAHNMQNLYSLSATNENKANSTYLLMEQNLELIKDSEKNSDSLTDTIKSIKEQSQEINKISNIISEIAFRTNLLSLNASVEAAHAGEKGRGFAVVASEIRNLANNCSEYAKEIKGLISKSETYTLQSVEYNKNNEKYMTAISKNILNSYNSLQEISFSSKEQKNQIESIENAISKINKGTHLNFSLSEKTVQLSFNMENSANQLSSSISKFSF